ncbi:MAG: hypothetical protein GTN74_04435 [Proteobacteria bacterium]|nr:hypothetical protein [Pseudomonadota bacterium]NIS68611.1 hypothetical protein [Pseudomonadota bacterium]
MAFIRAKKIRGHTYYYRVESYVENGRIKQRILKYLGKEIPEEYLHEYRKRCSGASSMKIEIPTRLTSVNPGKAKGERHGREKTRKILSD